MANSKLSQANNCFLSTHVHDLLAPLMRASKQPATKLLLAFSGGLDSSVLLHVLCGLQSRLRFTLSVMHVHHGISPNADAWATFCHDTCLVYGVQCEVKRIQLDRHSGLGLEATAREARYKALQNGCSDFIVLAHHQHDQAETLLLQLARGAGVKGLAGMAGLDMRRRYLRPLLDVARVHLWQYAQTHQLRWIDDESNDDPRYARNWMRHSVLPLLAQRYPTIHRNLSRTATHMAEAQQLLDELASIDAQQGIVATEQTQYPCLNVRYLHQLTAPRATNFLRFWLAQQALLLPSTDHLTQLRQQLLQANPQAALQVRVADGLWVRRYQNLAYLAEEESKSPMDALVWLGQPKVQLAHGQLTFEQTVGQGVSCALLASQCVTIVRRCGGERLKPALNRPARSLKHLLQAAQIPPWWRAGWPLIKIQQQLVCVPNVAEDVHWLAGPLERGWLIRWYPKPARGVQQR